MGSSVEGSIKTGGPVTVTLPQPTLLEEMKLLKEIQDQSGWFFPLPSLSSLSLSQIKEEEEERLCSIFNFLKILDS